MPHDSLATLAAIPAEVEEFAAKTGANRYLKAVNDLARRAFPSSALCVSLGQDAEDETHQYIAVDVEVAGKDAKELLAGQRIWSAEISRVCPSRHAVYFVLGWRSIGVTSCCSLADWLRAQLRQTGASRSAELTTPHSIARRLFADLNFAVPRADRAHHRGTPTVRPFGVRNRSAHSCIGVVGPTRKILAAQFLIASSIAASPCVSSQRTTG